MASANLELVRSILDAWERGDYGASAWAHPDIEYAHADGPEPGRWTGIAGMAEGWREFLSAWEGFHGENVELRELDGRRVLVLHSWRGLGKVSGIDVGEVHPAGAASLFEVRDGRVTRLVVYFDRELAFRDLGLSP